MDCDQFRRRLYYMLLAITGIINSLFISHLTLKGQISQYCWKPAVVEPMISGFPEVFILGWDSPVQPLMSEKRLLAAYPPVGIVPSFTTLVRNPYPLVETG